MNALSRSNVFAETVLPIMRAAKELGATPESVTSAFMAAWVETYGCGAAKHVSPSQEGDNNRNIARIDPIEHCLKIVEALKTAQGGAGNREYAAGRLSLSLRQLQRRISSIPKSVVTWPDAKGRLRFPKWQFGTKGMLPGVEECLAELVDPSAHWAAMQFFLTPAESAGDQSPLDLLRKGRISDAVTLARQTRLE
jgi:hypothetical protein